MLRTYFWQGAIASIKEKPLIGFKSSERQKFLEEYYTKTGKKEYINKYFGDDYLEVHNTYLQYWVQFGSIVFLYLCFFLFILIPKKIWTIKENLHGEYTITRFLKHGVAAAFISYYISGLTETTILKQVTIYVYIILLMLVNYMSVKRKSI
jgi:O-antigen ligase